MADAASERVSGPEERNEPIPRVERAAVLLPRPGSEGVCKRSRDAMHCWHGSFHHVRVGVKKSLFGYSRPGPPRLRALTGRCDRLSTLCWIGNLSQSDEIQPEIYTIRIILGQISRFPMYRHESSELFQPPARPIPGKKPPPEERQDISPGAAALRPGPSDLGAQSVPCARRSRTNSSGGQRLTHPTAPPWRGHCGCAATEAAII